VTKAHGGPGLTLLILAFATVVCLIGGSLALPVVEEIAIQLEPDEQLTDAELLSIFPEPMLATANHQVSQHGINKHPEATAIEKSCNKNVYQVWRDKRERKYYFLCKLEGDKWGIIPVIVTSAGEVWKTAFSPGTGCWGDTVRYLSSAATRYNGQVR
jgi:hypothetical protein